MLLLNWRYYSSIILQTILDRRRSQNKNRIHSPIVSNGDKTISKEKISDKKTDLDDVDERSLKFYTDVF